MESESCVDSKSNAAAVKVVFTKTSVVAEKLGATNNPHIVYGQFEWDSRKARANAETHGVTFEEAATVFEGSLFVIYRDPDHSFEESRYLIIGESDRGRPLLVLFTERSDRTRIISSRKLNAKEKRSYERKRKERDR